MNIIMNELCAQSNVSNGFPHFRVLNTAMISANTVAKALAC